ncbi:MAG: hypothetical protein KGZ25_07685 [Planctomycetes bacterium]|nr:hypothetical protein [Planctomycetota bacterium]
MNKKIWRRRNSGLLLASLVLVFSASLGAGGEPAQLSVKGNPKAIGRRFGEKFGKTIQELHPTFLRTACFMRREKPKQIYTECRRIARFLKRSDREEIKALARASGMKYEEVLFLNLFYTLIGDRLFCRQIAVWGKNTKDGELLHGRNLDWNDYPGRPLAKTHLILRVEPEGGVPYVSLTWPGLIGVITGTNKKGLTVAFNKLPAGEEDGGGEPVFFTIRRILRSCGSTKEAVQVLRKAKPPESGSILISNARRKTAVVVEMIDRKLKVRRPAEGSISNANHSATDFDIRGVRKGNADWPLGTVAERMGGPFDVESMKRALRHKDVLQNINLLSVVLKPSEGKMYLATGEVPAAEGKFREYSLFSGETSGGL